MYSFTCNAYIQVQKNLPVHSTPGFIISVILRMFLSRDEPEVREMCVMPTNATS